MGYLDKAKAFMREGGMERPYCPKCKAFCRVQQGIFAHPDLGEQTCLRCWHCGALIIMKDDKLEKGVLK